MAWSMTGYGSGSAAAEGREVTVELRAVNHRYLDLALRVGKALSFDEDALRKQIQSRLKRGHIDGFITYKNTRADARTVTCDTALAASYLQAAQALSRTCGVKNDLTAQSLLRLPGVTEEQEGEDDRDAMAALAQQAMEAALNELVAMRHKEGAALVTDLCARGEVIRTIVSEIGARVPQIEAENRERLTQKVTELLADVAFDKERLEQEVVLIVERGSITEELVRLDSHMKQMAEFLTSGDENGVGRKLDFLVQEMNREINTIGSKSADLEIANRVVRVKSEIEKIREQIQNIE